jgi:hypothetical protein
MDGRISRYVRRTGHGDGIETVVVTRCKVDEAVSGAADVILKMKTGNPNVGSPGSLGSAKIFSKV